MNSQVKVEDAKSALLSLLTAEQAHTFRAYPLAVGSGEVALAGDGSTQGFVPQLQLILGKGVRIEVWESDRLDSALLQAYPLSHQGGKEMAAGNGGGMEHESDVVRLVNRVFREAVAMEASDIHIERYEQQARIRFRWEGRLIEKFEVPLDQYNAVVSRIKIMAELDIAERRLPQDGRIHWEEGDKPLDIRVSSVPGKYGEKMVLRLLRRSQSHLQLKNIGLNEAEMEHYLKAIRRPNGIILITGPTGSGKTTTLYATLNQLNQPDCNIMTIEDPIEYNLQGINQVQLKEGIGLTFDRALRSFLRQDPDIIMVGEIRDVATAQIAIRAALTGHLVFSTLHTNTAWDAITRLMDMGIESYLLASSLRLVVAQRLLRKLCDHCKQISHEQIYPDLQRSLGIHTHYVPKGCSHCYYTGYKGRQAIFEILPIQQEAAGKIKEAARGMDTGAPKSPTGSLAERVAEWVRMGGTSLEQAIIHLES